MSYHNIFKRALNTLDHIESCTIYNWPNYANNGDHFLALGTFLYLIREHKTKVTAIKDTGTNSNKETCVIVGGGNFGDLWPNVHHKVREIVQKQSDNRIVIFPVSIYFENKKELKLSQEVFNGAKDVLLMCRDRKSYNLAFRYFSDCDILLAPDAAFYLEPLVKELSGKDTTLFLKRSDKELVQKEYLSYGVQEDWSHISFNLAKELPKEALISLNVLLSSVIQLKKFDKVLTDRLHAHILCVMLGMENTLLSNSYHKNESFYDTWTFGNSNTHFIK